MENIGHAIGTIFNAIGNAIFNTPSLGVGFPTLQKDIIIPRCSMALQDYAISDSRFLPTVEMTV